MKTIHPGEILYYDYMSKDNMVISDLSCAIDISTDILINVIMDKGEFTEELDAALHNYFGTKKGYWLNLQHYYNGEIK